MNNLDEETGELIKPSKGKGSFWVCRQAIDILLKDKATAMQINAYLVLAKHTNEGGKFSTAGIKAIHTATGVSHAVIEKAIDALKAMGTNKGFPRKLLYTSEDWIKVTSDVMPEAVFERARVRFVLNDFNASPSERVWFSNELITGFGKFTQPLKKLKRCGDVAARLLLIAYQENNLEQFGGISAHLFYENYDMSKVYNRYGYTIWHGNNEKTTAFSNKILLVLGLKEKDQDDQKWVDTIKPFWDAINALDTAGFIYQMVSIMDRKPDDGEAQVIYELDAKSRHGYKPKGELGLGGVTAKLSAHLGHSVTDTMGRFYGKYAAIVQTGIQPYMVGIYRLRFRVSNTKNYGVADAWARIYQGQNEAYEWIVSLAEQVDFELESEGANFEFIDAI